MPSVRFPASLPVLPIALLLSLLFSVVLITTHPQLNDDAFSYMRAAERYQQDGLGTVLQEYGWYGYSVLMALADPVLPGGLDRSAQILNTLCYLLLTWVFIAIQAEFGAGRRQLWLAAAAVLLLPLLNEMRHFIIRDVACWSFTLLSLLQLLRYQRQPGLQRALAWCACTLFAALFRLEALLPALFAPPALLLAHPERRAGLQQMLLLLACLLASTTLVLLLALASGVDLPGLMGFAWRYYLPLLLDFGTVLQRDALAVTGSLFPADNFPGNDNLGMGLLLLVLAHLSSVLFNLAAALGTPLALLLLYCRHQGPLLPRSPAGRLWLAYALPTLLALLVFQFIMHFQTQRYATLLALLMLMLLPIGLERQWQGLENLERQDGLAAGRRSRRWKILLGVIALYLSIDSLISFGYSKRYLQTAGTWLQQELPAAASVETNSFELAWRSQRIADYDKVETSATQLLDADPSADYLVMELNHRDADSRARLDAMPHYALLTRFANERGDEVRIYRRQP